MSRDQAKDETLPAAGPSYDFGLAADPAVQVLRVGHENEPVMVVDGLFRRPDSIVDFVAREIRFEPLAKAANFYPGLRAAAPAAYAQALYVGLRPTIDQVFAVPATAQVFASCTFSLATLAPAALNLAQRLPHFDNTDPRELAILHYLCDEPWGGTGFYRHRSTGFERVTAERSALYHQTLNKEVPAHPPPADYVRASSDLFEQTACIDVRFGRVVVYRGYLLHSGQVDAALGLSADPRRGRLTGNAFISFEDSPLPSSAML
jgi:hypothetical protein